MVFPSILKLARTIADLAGCDEIQFVHLAEALHVTQPPKVNDELIRHKACLGGALRRAPRRARVHILTPTAHPLEALATELMRDSDSVATMARRMDDLAQEPRSLALFLARARGSAKHHTGLVVDQFEELFTLRRIKFDREAFIDNLLNLVAPGQSNTTLIVTLRADFYARLAQYPELRDAVAQQENIGPMTAEELRLAIEEPAWRGH